MAGVQWAYTSAVVARLLWPRMWLTTPRSSPEASTSRDRSFEPAVPMGALALTPDASAREPGQVQVNPDRMLTACRITTRCWLSVLVRTAGLVFVFAMGLAIVYYQEGACGQRAWLRPPDGMFSDCHRSGEAGTWLAPAPSGPASRPDHHAHGDGRGCVHHAMVLWGRMASDLELAIAGLEVVDWEDADLRRWGPLCCRVTSMRKCRTTSHCLGSCGCRRWFRSASGCSLPPGLAIVYYSRRPPVRGS